MAKGHVFSMKLKSAQSNVTDAVRRADIWLAKQGIAQDMRDQAQLVLAEVLNNIVEHAYRDVQDGSIFLRIKNAAGCLTFQIRDLGIAFNPPSKTGLKDPLNCAFEDMPEGGFGWPLIHMLCEDVSFQREGAENHLRLTMPL